MLDTLPQAVTQGSNALSRADPLNEGQDGRGDNEQAPQAGPCLGAAHTHRASVPQPKQLQALPSQMPQGVGSTGPTSRTRSTKCPGLQRSQLRELPLSHGKDTLPAAHPAPRLRARRRGSEGSCLYWQAAGTRQEHGGKRIQLHSSGKREVSKIRPLRRGSREWERAFVFRQKVWLKVSTSSEHSQFHLCQGLT